MESGTSQAVISQKQMEKIVTVMQNILNCGFIFLSMFFPKFIQLI